MEISKAYWLYFNNAGTVDIRGVTGNQYEISLNLGWNLIGGVGGQILTGIADGQDVGDIDDPDGIIIDGTLFAWDDAFTQSYEMHPGKGYWIRTSEAGTVTITPPTNA